ncbi:GNAT family N-acetyltransferase [Pseudodesulfovibrio piezophilus]|uniref:GCN5-related N-acetyltransferase n=1 Tax=Pseudodesulfovibrio piezophilus (strain DSM 21447 / JCM 15486 / C1TLV30) TaxID=1322246 RepID=M1WRU9_PSEP2|nr:GNAT family N-acetyltransferase [Pseudodesulfovibrio piezophilus]CCH48527.1 GCN5-related N-acetyltransferase [Pseudodesulfovibrio piezophilus C1TLV30]
MSTPYTRSATEDDVFAMEQIMRDAFENSYAHFMPEQYVRAWFDTNQAQKSVRVGLGRAGVTEIMGRVVGFVMYLDNTITQLWVDPKYTRKGAGRALVEWIEGEYRTKGYPTITLYCYEANRDALEFYKKLRFRRASTFQSQDVQGGPVPVYTMLKMVSKFKNT